MRFLQTIVAIFVKDAAIDLRSPGILVSTAFVAVLTLVVAAFAFGANGLPESDAAAGALWIASSFAGVLAAGRTFARERELGAWTAVVASPAPRAAVFLGKAVGVTAFLLAVDMVLAPLASLFFRVPLLDRPGALAVALVLGTFGYATVCTLFAAMTVRSRPGDLLLGAIVFPLASPILLPAVVATAALAGGSGIDIREPLGLVAAVDVVYLVGGLWLFEPLVET